MHKALVAAIGIALFCASAFAQQASPPANAENSAAMEQRVRDLEDRIIALEGKIRTMEAAQTPSAAPPAAEAGAQPAQAPAPVAPASEVAAAPAPVEQLGSGGSSAASKALNPDISVIGDFIGAAVHWRRGQGNFQRVSQLANDRVSAGAGLDSHCKADTVRAFAEGNHGCILYDRAAQRALSSAVRAADS